MKHLHLSPKRILLFLICILSLISVLWVIFYSNNKNKSQDIYYFYDEVCASCDKNGDFIDLFNSELGDVKAQANYQLITSNTFEDGEKKWKQICKELKISPEKQVLPMVIIGNKHATGDTNIKQNLRLLFCENFDIAVTNTLWYYYRPTCKDCDRIEPFLKETLLSHAEITIIPIDTTDANPKEMFKQNLDKWGVPKEKWQVPFLYNGRDYLSGDLEIESKLHEFLEQVQ